MVSSRREEKQGSHHRRDRGGRCRGNRGRKERRLRQSADLPLTQRPPFAIRRILWFGTRPSSPGVPSGVWKPCFLPHLGNRDSERGEPAIPLHPAANLGLSPGMAEGCSFPSAIHSRFLHWNGFNQRFSFRHPAMGRIQSDICREERLY